MSARVFDAMCWAGSCFFAIDVNKNVCIWLYNTDQCTIFFLHVFKFKNSNKRLSNTTSYHVNHNK